MNGRFNVQSSFERNFQFVAKSYRISDSTFLLLKLPANIRANSSLADLLMTNEHKNKNLKLFPLLFLASVFALICGCGTTTQRVATEQLLISDAVDRAIERIDFRAIANRSVYLDVQYLAGIKGSGAVNGNYIISSIRQQLLAANCRIRENRQEADVIVEPRVGALGTDGHEVTYGIPQTNALSTAASVLANAPLLPSIPEVSVGRSNAQAGMAKIVVFAYDRESRQPIWQSGISKAESTSKSTWLFGAGPFQRGSIYDGVRFAGEEIKKNYNTTNGPNIDYASEYHFPDPADSKSDERVASTEKSKEEKSTKSR